MKRCEVILGQFLADENDLGTFRDLFLFMFALVHINLEVQIFPRKMAFISCQLH